MAKGKNPLSLSNILLHTPVTLVIAVLIALVLNTGMAFLVDASAVFGSALTLFSAAILLALAIAWHPGKEEFVNDLVVILLVLAVSALLTPFVPQLAFTIQLTSLAALSLGLATIYFARAISGRIFSMAGVKV